MILCVSLCFLVGTSRGERAPGASHQRFLATELRGQEAAAACLCVVSEKVEDMEGLFDARSAGIISELERREQHEVDGPGERRATICGASRIPPRSAANPTSGPGWPFRARAFLADLDSGIPINNLERGRKEMHTDRLGANLGAVRSQARAVVKPRWCAD